MGFLLLQDYGGVESDCRPMTEWTPEDIFQHALNKELSERGELVDAQGLAAPDQAKFVVSDGSNPLLAGYRMVDVPTVERALEIAAQASASPGRTGCPSASASRCARG